MERYEMANGDVYEIIRYTDECAVAKNGNLVYSGPYKDCRLFIDRDKKGRA